MRLYQTFVSKTALPINAGEAPAAFAKRARGESRLDDRAIDEVTARYLVARYGAPDSQALAKLQRSVSRL